MPDRVGVLRLRHVAVETIIPKELKQRLAILNPGPGGLAFYIGTYAVKRDGIRSASSLASRPRRYRR